MDQFYEEIEEPVSPQAQYFSSSVICSYVFGFLEMTAPIDDDLPIIPLVEQLFLPINPRFSSIMVTDQAGKKRWKRVQVWTEEHIIFPKFPECNSCESYDKYFDEYVTRTLSEPTPKNKPLWEIHIIKYPRSSAASTIIFKLHHALGDGYSLMCALLSCLQRADDPSLPLTFPSREPSNPRHAKKKNMFKKLHSVVSFFFNSMLDFGSSLLKSKMIEDDKTPIRSGYEGTDQSTHFAVSNISLSLDHIKAMKSKLGVTLNDVVTGIIFYGIRLYMQEIDQMARKSISTALVVLNTRTIRGYKSVEDLQKPKTKGLWGNKISFLHIPIPNLRRQIYNPLEFIWYTHKLIKMKRRSFGVYLVAILWDLEMKLRGPEAAAKTLYNTMGNCSVLMSNLVGPVEQMTLANLPVSGLYFTMTGGPQSITVTIMSYGEDLKITLKTIKGLIDEQKLKFCIEKAFDAIFKAAM